MTSPKTPWRGILLALAALALAACAAGPNHLTNTPDAHGMVAGFWRGLWHGLILPVTFIVSFFSRNVGLYEVHNNGAWYDVGFVLGLAMSLGGSHGVSRANRRRAPDAR